MNIRALTFDLDDTLWDNRPVRMAADILIATQLVLGQRVPGTLQYAYGDINTDSKIALSYLLLIMQAVFLFAHNPTSPQGRTTQLPEQAPYPTSSGSSPGGPTISPYFS